MTERIPLTLRGRRFAYTDTGGAGTPVVALHGVFGSALDFAEIGALLAPDYRLVALDQRGHGLSEHGGDFGRDAFVGDAAAFVAHLGLAPAIVLGHSLGGVTAYQLAARHPGLVRALVVADIGAVTDGSELDHPVLDITDWPRTAPSRDALARFLADRDMPALGYFMASAYDDGAGWRMRFDHDDMMAAQHGNSGDWWSDWLAAAQPALLVRGERSMLLSERQAQAMVRRRPGTRLRELPGCGHWVHRDDPAGFVLAVRAFLDGLARTG
ncbi:pimeloyl-ACP methyl ester carboxylesterase [Murinocardiopsis flavida]|uniref:Pimeloyl-ACP methyl ester carboxylesterase n=1 Tax=Murinocardiopsis flavida TaxID=645275 RepID=A0A2P8CXG7_9ACTN|nr:alpha/beta hydrolase [Murinocardiopsis flavida]PSK89671.1 pimeloyl-ACP methyl ester carboxylesterase [Murinocardiopsis flavida]